MSLIKLPKGDIQRGPTIYLCTTEDSFLKLMKKHKVKYIPHKWLGDDAIACVHHFECAQHGYTCVVCICKEKRPIYHLASVMAHEATHIWQGYCEDIGERVPGKEQEAYAIEDIVYRLVKAYLDKA